MSATNDIEWDRGYYEAIAYCEANYKPFQPIRLPDSFRHRGTVWSKGFGEGLLMGMNKIIDAAYPGNVGFSIGDNGKVTIRYPKGHPALKNKPND